MGSSARGSRRLRSGALCAALLFSGAATACAGQDRGLSEAQLGALIDSILPEIAEVSGMQVRRPVQYSLQSREEARAFLERQLEDELGDELQGMERAYKAFGLLPDTLDLRALMLELLTEQVVGYYDPPTERLYVVAGAPAAAAEPVVAHELVHALQDQHTDLEAIVAPERGNDRQMAAQAAAEGQAMLVMLALQAARTTGEPMDPGALPDLGPMMRPAVESENSRFPVFRSAPRIIRESLLFPYIGGATFVQALFRATDDTPVPFGDLLPESTEQVMTPERFLADRDPPTDLELGPASDGWSVIYENNLGQLETGILLAERLGPEAEAAAWGWDGDRYALLEGPSGEQALVWYTVWDDTASADRFIRVYRRWAESGTSAGGAGVGRGAATAERLEVEGRPVVRIVESHVANRAQIGQPELVGMWEGSGP